MTTITEQLNSAIKTIRTNEKKYARSPQSVDLLAVSKTKPVSDISQAITAGQRHFGENYVQEGVDKIIHFNDSSLIWHFIGPLQSNKTRPVAEHFDWVHTIDRLKIAKRLNEQRPQGCKPLNVCIQVNISGEQSKSGITVNEVPVLAQAIDNMPNLTLRGLMTIGQKSTDPQVTEQQFKQMNQLFETLKKEFATVDTLSMGMSADIEPAIAHGSTMVRIGSAIFGQRI
ncbi:YggS family pyridoxal phosphate-dependent enzyme [Psychrobium sp. 1_MG-2023]|uniref:YggS family pyridoxal phosphate-dependent enzyme n=1 Tax=Psychrobium sp. 1_MG-2023 TaxID=3062624 RepID=UPI000C32318C|nr:YggS family pyridoxal phosphate-dependent enzyme [Psychrobium sp. 1_MG-2023]MDP2562372.1 YggS family pyridoxal phosphate-dependent enzyme [Psychrobium sp. 1_MG-2023]PKF55862.1 YggS family pyridoxal phosphate-dependent enzyme [Alteromonadales bacterium alter-6D02]